MKADFEAFVASEATSNSEKQREKNQHEEILATLCNALEAQEEETLKLGHVFGWKVCKKELPYKNVIVGILNSNQ